MALTKRRVAVTGFDQNITTHDKRRLLREGQLTKHEGKGLRPVAGVGITHAMDMTAVHAGVATGNADTVDTWAAKQAAAFWR